MNAEMNNQKNSAPNDSPLENNLILSQLQAGQRTESKLVCRCKPLGGVSRDSVD